MKHVDILNRLQPIFRDLFDDDTIEVTDITTANDIEDWDSLAHLQLINLVEEEFNIHFSLGEINNFANVGEMVDTIAKHLG